jgi:hypothetical protein
MVTETLPRYRNERERTVRYRADFWKVGRLHLFTWMEVPPGSLCRWKTSLLVEFCIEAAEGDQPLVKRRCRSLTECAVLTFNTP